MSNLPVFSPELALLAACDLASDKELAARLADGGQGLDWERFDDLATTHDMSAMAGARLARVAPGAMPQAIAERFAQHERENTVLLLGQARLSVQLQGVLDAAGIRSIVIKGMALAHMIYPQTPQWRSSTDIDLLVAPEDFLSADRALREAGYQRKWPEGDLPGAGQDMLLLLANVFDYTCPCSGQLIELHHRLTLNPHWFPVDFADLHASAGPVESAAGAMLGLDGPLLCTYLSWHALGHYGFRLKWLCDIVRVLDRAGVQTCAGYLPTGQKGLSPAPALIIDSLLKPLRAAVGHAPAGSADPRWQGTVRRILRDLETPSDMPSSRSLTRLPGELAQMAFFMRLCPRPRSWAYQWLRTVSDPRDVSVLRVGRRAALLYALAGPVLALRRLLLRTLNLHDGPDREAH